MQLLSMQLQQTLDVSLQPEHNLCDRADIEAELESLCLEKTLSVINYFSLASGIPTGRFRSEADLGKSARAGGIGNYLNNHPDRAR